MVVFIAKLSLLLLYFRLFSVARGLRYSIFFGIGFMSLFYTIIMFLFIFLNESKFLSLSYAVGSVNIVTDLYILILPMVPVSRMQLSKKKKIGVQCIFLTASLYVQHTPSIAPRKRNGIPAYRVNPGLALLVY